MIIKKHLAIFDPQTAELILTGKKTIETRFSIKKIAPFSHVGIGDLVYIKPIGKELAGQFVVSKVIYFEGLDDADLEFIRKHFGKQLSLGSKEADDAYFKTKRDSKYGTVIFITQVEHFITPPIKIPKRDQRGWVVLAD